MTWHLKRWLREKMADAFLERIGEDSSFVTGRKIVVMDVNGRKFGKVVDGGLIDPEREIYALYFDADPESIGAGEPNADRTV